MPSELPSSKTGQGKVSNKSNTVPAMLAAALSSADRVLRDLNLAHSKKNGTSSTDSASSRVHAKAKALHVRSQK
jgi:hypothetical protein